ncbi:MAG: Mut7-C ubiquitin/RNAse domain-containing protein, partial [Cyclobacteriaceae bacterium]|nr:Mut7-C ubiquitin/RNAse domain-containing protein [Cyclobacteriaceae bacterium]
YEELNDFLLFKYRKKRFEYNIATNTSVKDAIESLGVPHTEIDLILINSISADFSYNLKEGDYVSVYPKFESFDISELTKIRSKPLRETKFILDVHLGKLAKYLRLLGFDTLYFNNLDDPEIIEIAKAKNRIILTRDLGILKNNKVTHGYWLRSQDSKEQLKEVIQRFDLKNKLNLFSRCTICNGDISKIDKSLIKNQIHIKTFNEFNTFYQCKNCKKIYWKGSHYERMLEMIDGLVKSIPSPVK